MRTDSALVRVAYFLEADDFEIPASVRLCDLVARAAYNVTVLPAITIFMLYLAYWFVRIVGTLAWWTVSDIGLGRVASRLVLGGVVAACVVWIGGYLKRRYCPTVILERSECKAERE